MTSVSAIRKNSDRFTLIFICSVTLGCAALGFIGGKSLGFLNPVLLLLSIALFIAALTHSALRYVSGFLSLVSFVSILAFLEGTLWQVPDNMLPRSIIKAPPLAPIDQAKLAFDTHGFRGQQPCKTTCPDNLVRIITLGGSSTFGLPLVNPQATYSGQLQRFLDERRPFENYEVLNAGLAGAGVMQELDLLRERLLTYKPDIVTINSWFNDSSRVPGWYGVKGKSDKEAFESFYLLWKLQDFKWYKALHETRLFAAFRYLLLKISEKFSWGSSTANHTAGKKRMDSKEFEWALEQVIALGREHDFLPVFMLEPYNRSFRLDTVLGSNHYYKVTKRLADKHHIPLVDLPTTIHNKSAAWLFYDFIHPNLAGHRVIAESLFDTLLNDPIATQFLKSRGIDTSRPLAKPYQKLTVAAEEIKASSTELVISLPYKASRLLELGVWYGNQQLYSADLDGVANKIVLPGSILNEISQPYVTLRFKAHYKNPDKSKYLVGTTGVASPRILQLISAGKIGGSEVEIRIDGVKADQNQRGFNVIALGAATGNVHYVGSFDIFGSKDQNKAFAQFFRELPSFTEQSQPAIIVIAVKTDGYHNLDRELASKLFQSIGGTGKVPQEFGSFILVGVPGAKPGTGIERIGDIPMYVELGEVSQLAETLITMSRHY